MKKVLKLKETDLQRIVKRVVKEQDELSMGSGSPSRNDDFFVKYEDLGNKLSNLLDEMESLANEYEDLGNEADDYYFENEENLPQEELDDLEEIAGGAAHWADTLYSISEKYF